MITMTDEKRIEQLIFRLRDIDILRLEALDGLMEASSIISLFLDGKVDIERLRKLQDSLKEKIHSPCVPFNKTEWAEREAAERLSYGMNNKTSPILPGDTICDSLGKLGKVLSTYEEDFSGRRYCVDLHIRVQMEGETEPINIKLTEVKKVE